MIDEEDIKEGTEVEFGVCKEHGYPYWNYSDRAYPCSDDKCSDYVMVTARISVVRDGRLGLETFETKWEPVVPGERDQWNWPREGHSSYDHCQHDHPMWPKLAEIGDTND